MIDSTRRWLRSTVHGLLASLALAGAVTGADLAPSSAAPAREVHGSSDAYATAGVALAWAVLRGADDASTRVVLRIALDPAVYPALEVTGVDPFTRAERTLLPRGPTAAVHDVRVPRSQFADWPRTELRFQGPSPAPGAGPALLVFFQGVPDTAPEFTTEARLSAYLDERLARARRDATGAPP